MCVPCTGAFAPTPRSSFAGRRRDMGPTPRFARCEIELLHALHSCARRRRKPPPPPPPPPPKLRAHAQIRDAALQLRLLPRRQLAVQRHRDCSVPANARPANERVCQRLGVRQGPLLGHLRRGLSGDVHATRGETNLGSEAVRAASLRPRRLLPPAHRHRTAAAAALRRRRVPTATCPPIAATGACQVPTTSPRSCSSTRSRATSRARPSPARRTRRRRGEAGAERRPVGAE